MRLLLLLLVDLLLSRVDVIAVNVVMRLRRSGRWGRGSCSRIRRRLKKERKFEKNAIWSKSIKKTLWSLIDNFRRGEKKVSHCRVHRITCTLYSIIYSGVVQCTVRVSVTFTLTFYMQTFCTRQCYWKTEEKVEIDCVMYNNTYTRCTFDIWSFSFTLNKTGKLLLTAAIGLQESCTFKHTLGVTVDSG